MGKVMAGTGLVAILVAGMAVAQQRERLPAECREEIRALCQMGGGMRECVRAALPKLSDSCRNAIGERGASAPPAPGSRELTYGADPKQRLDLLVPPGTKRAPLLLFVHGGGWSIGDKRTGAGVKAAHFTAQGWAFASANYRLVPQVSVEQQAADIAAAIAWARSNAVAHANFLNPKRSAAVQRASY